MNKKKVLFIILAVISVFVFIFGFLYFSVVSIPFQDPQYVPDNAIVRQAAEILVGKVAMLAGVGLFIGSVIGATVTGKKVDEKMDA